MKQHIYVLAKHLRKRHLLPWNYGLLFMTDCIKQLTRSVFGNYNNSGG